MCSILRISVFAVFFAITLAIAPNSVHVNLETRIRIGSQENIHNVLQNITSFLDKLKYALIPTHKDQINRRAQETKTKSYFTNFVNDVVQVILNLKYEETIWFFKRLYEEIKYYFKYKGSAFADIVKNPLVKKYLEDILKEWAETDPYIIKNNIRNYIATARNNNYTLNRLGDFIDNFYEEKDEKKMQETVNKLKNCRKEKDFVKVITAALHNLVIKHYDNLNYTIRTKISDEINRLSEYAIKRRSKGDTGDLNSTSKIIDNIMTNNVSSVGNITLTTKVIPTVKPIDKGIHENIIASPEKGFVENDIEKIKNKYSKVKDIFKDSDNNTVLRQNTESNKPTKRRLMKITTKSTTHETIKTSKVLKRFKLKPRPIESINGTNINTTVPQDINDANITTPVPHNISDGTAINKAQANNGTSLNTTIVVQNTNTTANMASVPQNINNTTVPQNKETTHNAITSPVLRVNKENDEPTKSAANILKRKIIDSLPIIPVPRPVKTTTIPELRVFGNNKRKHPKTGGKIRKVPKKGKKKKIGGVKKKVIRRPKKTTVYMSPDAKREVARIARLRKRKKIVDIEERIDAEGIDGK